MLLSEDLLGVRLQFTDEFSLSLGGKDGKERVILIVIKVNLPPSEDKSKREYLLQRKVL